MRTRFRSLKRGAASFGLAAFISLLASPAVGPQAATLAAPGGEKSVSGLPVPRFVSLKAARVNVRVGPGEDYKVAWVFTRPGLPIEVIQEFDNWRRIRDSDGTVGWVFQSLLSGKRTAVVAPWQTGEPLPVRDDATSDATITAYLEPGVMGTIDRCRDNWCRISGNGYSGWISQDRLWGVYPNENVD